MKKLIVLIVIAVALLFSGCNPVAPDYPECPDCICPECPGYECPCVPGCPDIPECPDCNCPDYPEGEKPVIILFEADPDTLECRNWCSSQPMSRPQGPGPPHCNDESTISWEVVGADIVDISGQSYVDAAGSFKVKCGDLDLGENTWILTATNSWGSDTADVIVTRTTLLSQQPQQ